MKRRVVVTENAKADLRSYYRHAAQHAPETATRWLNRFESALMTLSTNAERCAVAPENESVDAEIRQMLFGKGRRVYRALFTIEGEEVRVLHIRRATMDTAPPDELDG